MERLPNHIVFKEAEASLKKGKVISIRIVGKSMEPFLIDNKDIVKIMPFSFGKLHLGDIVLFKIDNFYCLHRIISINKRNIVLCGDGIYQSKERIVRDNVLGILDSVIQESGKVTDCNSIKWKIKSYVWMALYPFRKYLLFAFRKWSRCFCSCTIKQRGCD